MIRFGMCGCGSYIEMAVLPMMQKVENAEIVAAFDVDKQRVDRICREFNIKRACPSFDDLIGMDEVDIIYIASPNVLHKSQVIAAAEAGKHVFCQKPLGMNADECREMITACRDNGAKLGVGFCYRFGGAQQKAKELIREGAIGEVSHVYFSFNLGGYSPETVGWRCDPKKSGGGPLMDLAPHMIDLVSFLLDDRVESVMAYVRPQKTEFQIEMDVLAMLQFSNGTRMCVDTSFVRNNTHNYVVVGERGQLHAVGTMPWLTGGNMVGKLELQTAGKGQEVTFSEHEHIEQEIGCLCEAVDKGVELPVPGEAGLHAQAVVDAIYESGRTGRICRVEADMEST